MEITLYHPKFWHFALGLSCVLCRVYQTWALDWTAQFGVLMPPLIASSESSENSSHHASVLSPLKWAYVDME